MPKYHIATSGQPAVCKAQSQASCPRGGRHFTSVAEAQFWQELNPPQRQQPNPSPFDALESDELARRLTLSTAYEVATDDRNSSFTQADEDEAYANLRAAGYSGSEPTWRHDYLKAAWDRRYPHITAGSYLEREGQLTDPPTSHTPSTADDVALALAKAAHPAARNLEVHKFDRQQWDRVYNWLGWQWPAYDRNVDAPSTLHGRGKVSIGDGDWIVRSGTDKRREIIGVVRGGEVNQYPLADANPGIALLRAELLPRLASAEATLRASERVVAQQGVAPQARLRNKIAAVSSFRRRWGARFAAVTSASELQQVLTDFNSAHWPVVSRDDHADHYPGWQEGMDLVGGYAREYLRFAQQTA